MTESDVCAVMEVSRDWCVTVTYAYCQLILEKHPTDFPALMCIKQFPTKFVPQILVHFHKGRRGWMNSYFLL